MSETAVELNPNSSEALRNLAQAYNRVGQKEKAALTDDRAISAAYNELQVNPRKADAMGTLAMCYAAKGELSRAQQFIQNARSIDSANSQLCISKQSCFHGRAISAKLSTLCNTRYKMANRWTKS